MSGRRLGELPLPERFRIGRKNHSFEGLALGTGAQDLLTTVETPLGVDGRTEDLRGRHRILHYRTAAAGEFVPFRKYLYLGDAGLVELLAVSDDRLFVVERSFTPNFGNGIGSSRPHSRGRWTSRVSRRPGGRRSRQATRSGCGAVPRRRECLS
jgi:hypothetical protein